HRRRLSGNQHFRASGSDQIYTDLRAGKLSRAEPAIVVVARQIVEPVAALDAGASVVPAIGIAIGDADMASGVNLGDCAEILRLHWIGGIDYARRVGVGNIQLIRSCDKAGASVVADKGNRLSVSGKVQRQLGFRAEAGYYTIAGHRKRTDE